MQVQFLNLKDAVNIAVDKFDIDESLARQEFEQKCYISSKDYENGFYDGIDKAIETLRNLGE